MSETDLKLALETIMNSFNKTFDRLHQRLDEVEVKVDKTDRELGNKLTKIETTLDNYLSRDREEYQEMKNTIKYLEKEQSEIKSELNKTKSEVDHLMGLYKKVICGAITALITGGISILFAFK